MYFSLGVSLSAFWVLEGSVGWHESNNDNDDDDDTDDDDDDDGEWRS